MREDAVNKFRLFVECVKGRCSFFLSEADMPDLVINLWVDSSPITMVVVNQKRRWVAVSGVVLGLEDPTLVVLRGSGNTQQFFNGWIGLGWELELEHLNGELIQLGKVGQIQLVQDAKVWRALASEARSPKRWRDIAHARRGVCQEVLHALPFIFARRSLKLFPLFPINGRMALASFLIKANELELFEEAIRLVAQTLKTDWVYQAPDARGDPLRLPINREIWNRLWTTIAQMHAQESSHASS